MFEEIKLGPCSLAYGSLDIDLTEGGVTLHVEPILKDIKVDQFGESIIDQRITGWTIKAVVPLAQTDFDSIKLAATFLEESTPGAGLRDRELGTSMRALGSQLTLHPLEIDDASEDVIFYLATPVTAMELKYGYGDQRVYNVEFLALPKDAAAPADAGNYLNIGGSAIARYLATFTVTAFVGGAPIAGAEVKLTGVVGTKLTDALGVTTFTLAPDEYGYAVSKVGYNTAVDAVVVVAAPVNVAVALTV